MAVIWCSPGYAQWAMTHGGNNDEWAHSIQQTADGGYVVAGSTDSFGAGGSDAWVLKLGSDGTILWQSAYGGSQEDSAQSIQQTADGGYVVAGTTDSFGAGDGNFWTLNLDAHGEIPDCSAMATTEVILSDTSAMVSDTSVTPLDISPIADNTNISSENTPAETSVICSAPMEITDILPGQAVYGTEIEATGYGFGQERSGVFIHGEMGGEQCGYCSFVTFSDVEPWPWRIVATHYPMWSDDSVRFVLEDLFIDLDGDYLRDDGEPSTAVVGSDMTLCTIWFYDLNSNAIYDQEDEIYYSECTNSHAFNQVEEPIIYRIRSRVTIEPGKVIKIIGEHFGNVQGQGVVHINNKMFDSTSAKIKLWSDTMIKVKIPKYKCSWFKGNAYRKRKVWVTVDGVDSNIKTFKVIKPATCP